MLNFHLNFNDIYEGQGKVEDGWYEVVVSRCNEDVTSGGAKYTEFELIIRNDIDQPFKNMHLFPKVWRSKKDNRYNMKMFNTIGKACQLQNGKSYAGLDELLNDFVHKKALVYVENQTSEYQGKIYENTNVKIWDQTKSPYLQHQFRHRVADGGNDTTSEVTADDLPF